jgi:hypothetical protein
VQSWAWDFNNDQIVDSTLQNPQFTFTGVGYDKKFTVSLEVTDNSNPTTAGQEGLHRRQPVPGRERHDLRQGLHDPCRRSRPDPDAGLLAHLLDQLAGPRLVGSGPGDLHITGFNVPNEQSATDQSVWFFTTPNTTQPSSYTPTAADTKFLGTGPVGTTLTPTAPIVVQQGTWFGVMGACHDAAGTTMHNSYDAGSTASQTTTVLGNPMPVRRLTANMNFVTNATVGTIAMSFATSGQIARVDVDVPGNLQSTIPLLAASGDTPYFGGNPRST